MNRDFGSQARPCCVPHLARVALLETSRRQSEHRNRVTSGSAEGMVRLESARFLMGTYVADGFPDDGEGPIRAIHMARR